MENATKALIIAGAVLIAIIVISIGVSLWVKYADFSKQTQENIRAQQLDEFNTKFEKYDYSDTRKNYITAQEVRTIVNLANEYNNKYDEKIISVTYRGMDLFKWKEEKWVEFLNESNPNAGNSEGIKYKCIVKKPDSKDIVREIEIQN